MNALLLHLLSKIKRNSSAIESIQHTAVIKHVVEYGDDSRVPEIEYAINTGEEVAILMDGYEYPYLKTVTHDGSTYYRFFRVVPLYDFDGDLIMGLQFTVIHLNISDGGWTTKSKYNYN